ncbi:MAG TPA: pyrroloquinoline quinone-dependent dehydrogenase [Myxococcaceae bacterium]|nr:pyrroloquinoline quinone-dependent dehydrogenase [Myxococcaceae bacterium]
MSRPIRAAFAALALCCARAPSPPPPPPPTPSADGDWPAYGHTALGDRFSPLSQIDRENVARLQVAWRFHTGELDPAFATARTTALEATPLVVEGTMYLSTPLGRVFALDPVTGQPRWSFDPKLDRKVEYGDFNSRGVSSWRDPNAPAGAPCAARIFDAVMDGRLIALDAATGAPCAGFGAAGTVNLREGLRNAPPAEDFENYEETSPPAVINGLVVVGSAVADNNNIDAPSGVVRAFDARTGALRWSWDPVVQDPSDPAYQTWIGPNAHRAGAANVWSIIAADPERDLVILPTSSPSVDYFGGERRGQNLYANAVVALRASTGARVWHFQTVHHDLWDYDNAAPPALVTLRAGDRSVPAVLQATKTGQLFALDRETGAPLIPVEERPAPKSDVPGEEAWPTQPWSALPPLSPQRLRPEEAWGPTEADRAWCEKRLRALRNEGAFTPPSERGTLVIPSNIGGAHWGGLAYDPARELAVVPTNRIAAVIRLIPRAEYQAMRERRFRGERIGVEYAPMTGTPYALSRETFLGQPSGAPCTPPPFGSLVAVNLRTRAIAWSVPFGTTEGLDKVGLKVRPDLQGMISLGGPIITAGGLVFIGASTDAYFRAFDVETGKELWKAKLPAGGKATPMTYRGADGRQYVVVAAGGDGKVFGKADEVVAFALPRD